jgi:hypothetical protein
MKSTILFLTLLVFISASSNLIDSSSYDSVLLEMAQDPRSEAIFATMAVQLRQNAGFDRVLALLNELVDDGRKQLHEANKLWKSTEARCDVSTMKFAERQAFYENKNTHIAESLEATKSDRDYADSTEKFLGTSAAWFSKFLADEQTRHKIDAEQAVKLYATAQAAVDNTDTAIKVVSEWTQGAPAVTKTALVQEKLNLVAASYLQIKSYKIVVPESFVQMAASDEQVRQRLLEWLGTLRITFLEAKDSVAQQNADVQTRAAEIEKAIGDLLYVYDGDQKFAHEQIAVHEAAAKTLSESAELFKKLVGENAALVLANNNYCTIEKANYSTAKSMIEDQLKLFRDVRTYFRNNYSKINKFVKGKYGKSEAAPTVVAPTA